MLWNIHHIARPADVKGPFIGFNTITLLSRNSSMILMPIDFNGSIIDTIPYEFCEQLGNKAAFAPSEIPPPEGATQLAIGQSTLYGFNISANARPNIATRDILAPQLENWLRAGKFDVPDAVVEDAKRFCDGHEPEALKRFNDILWDVYRNRRGPLN